MDEMTLEEAFAAATVDVPSGMVDDIFVIDAPKRKIIVPDSESVFGVETDMDVERKYFRCPRIVGDNIDLYAHKIYVVYVTAKDVNGTFLPEIVNDKYWCDDVAVDGDCITFSWVLSDNVLSKSGIIAFKILAATTENGLEKTRWNTAPAYGTVLMTVPDGNDIAERYPDIVTQLLERMDAVEAIATEEAMQGYVNKYLGEHPVVAGATEEQAAQIDQNTQGISELKSDLGELTDDVLGYVCGDTYETTNTYLAIPISFNNGTKYHISIKNASANITKIRLAKTNALSTATTFVEVVVNNTNYEYEYTCANDEVNYLQIISTVALSADVNVVVTDKLCDVVEKQKTQVSQNTSDISSLTESMKGFVVDNVILDKTDYTKNSGNGGTWVRFSKDYTMDADRDVYFGMESAVGSVHNVICSLDIISASGTNSIGLQLSQLPYKFHTPSDFQKLTVTYYLSRNGTAIGSNIDVTFKNVFLYYDNPRKVKSINGEISVDIYPKSLGEIATNSICTWIDDDTPINTIPVVKSICDSLGIKCTFGCITGLLTNQSGLDDLLKSYQLDGYSIVSHGSNHGDVWKYWDTSLYDKYGVETEMITSRVSLMSNGYVEHDFIVSPFNGATKEIQDIAKKYYRGLVYGTSTPQISYVNHLADEGRYSIKSIFITKSYTADDYKEIIDYAFANGDWLVFRTHSNSSSEWDTDLVTEVMTYAKNKGMDFCTLPQAFRKREAMYYLEEATL